MIETIERKGTIVHELWTPDEHGGLRLAFRESMPNIITEVGDRYYAERAASPAGTTPPGQVTGMQLGAGATTPAKTGAGAAIVTLVTNSLVGIVTGYPTSLLAAGRRRITWRSQWNAGVATGPIAEVALVNQALATQTAAPASATIARALVTAFSKGTDDIYIVTWHHDNGTL